MLSGSSREGAIWRRNAKPCQTAKPCQAAKPCQTSGASPGGAWAGGPRSQSAPWSSRWRSWHWSSPARSSERDYPTGGAPRLINRRSSPPPPQQPPSSGRRRTRLPGAKAGSPERSLSGTRRPDTIPSAQRTPVPTRRCIRHTTHAPDLHARPTRTLSVGSHGLPPTATRRHIATTDPHPSTRPRSDSDARHRRRSLTARSYRISLVCGCGTHDTSGSTPGSPGGSTRHSVTTTRPCRRRASPPANACRPPPRCP